MKVEEYVQYDNIYVSFLKFMLICFGHLMQRVDSLEKTLILGRNEGSRRRRWQMGWLAGVIDSTDVSMSKLQELVKVSEAWHAVVHGATWTVDTAEQLNNNNNVL